MKEFICRYPFNIKRYEIKILKPEGEFAHENFPESRYAVDFKLPLGTPVLAVKKGTVIIVKHDSDVYFRPKQLSGIKMHEIMNLAVKSLNYIGIDHGNGTFTEYCHLSKRKVVLENQSVEEGDVIGYTGKSGIMDLYHLHFNACKIENKKGVSIPVGFVK